MATATYPIINQVACVPERKVSFKTYNQLDSQTYYGTITGCVNYTIAAKFGDVDAIHGNMTPSVAKQNITSQTFLIVQTSDGASRPFATIWIDEGTFKQTDVKYDAEIVIHNITETELYKVLTAIRDMGYDVTQKTR